MGEDETYIKDIVRNTFSKTCRGKSIDVVLIEGRAPRHSSMSAIGSSAYRPSTCCFGPSST